MNVKSDITWRIMLTYAIMVVFGIAIIVQILHIQISEGKHWRSMADSATLKYINILAERGNIYSEDGRLIATSLPTFEIHFDAEADGLTEEVFNESIDSLCLLMNHSFPSKSVSEYKALIIAGRHKKDRYQLLLRNVSYPQLVECKKWPIFRLGRNRGGFMVKQIDKRLYPYNDLALRTIGYIKEDKSNGVGIEEQYNTVLSGIPGKQLSRRISNGVYMPLDNNYAVEPKNGKDIITTIDVSLQDQAESALKRALITNDALHGCVIVMEVQTGKIKALANLGKNKEGKYEEVLNYAIGDNLEPGSTFKTASLLALLEDGYVNLNDTIDVEGGTHKYGKQIMKDAEEHGYRKISVLKAFAISSNVGISKLVSRYYSRQPERYLSHLHDWKLDDSLLMDLPGERKPLIRNPGDNKWSTFTLPWMSVGYELTELPINIATFYNAIANRGVMMKPYVVSEIDEYGKPIQKYKPIVLIKKLCSDSTLKKLNILLQAVVNAGTATNLKNPYYSIAGKTGTAIITHNLGRKDSMGKSKTYQASFCGYFPIENPLYTICVVINSPSKGFYYGAKVAGPCVKEIADKVYANVSSMRMTDTIGKNIQELNPLTCKGYSGDLISIYKMVNKNYNRNTTAPWVNVVAESGALKFEDFITTEGTIPDVRGMGLRDALYLLENKGLVVKITGAGTVRQQSLRAGQTYKKGQTIILTLS